MDSMVITSMLKEKDTSNLKPKNFIRRTSKTIEGADLSISRCYREANQVADFLDKLASSSENGTFYFSYISTTPERSEGTISTRLMETTLHKKKI